MDLFDYDNARSEYRKTGGAINIIEALVIGRNPVTRAHLPPDHFILDEKVLNALWVALSALDETALKQKRKIERYQRKLAE